MYDNKQMTHNMNQIVSLIEESIKNDIMRFLPKIANKKLSFHELEAIFFNHGNGHRLFMSEYNDGEAWEALSQKEKNAWNSKAKKSKSDKEEEMMCNAKKKDGSDCTSKAKDNGLCGKHKDIEHKTEIAKKIATKEKKEKKEEKNEEVVKMKRKKIDGVFYHVDEDNKVFDTKTNELKGTYNPETKKIEQEDDFFDNSSIDGADLDSDPDQEDNDAGSEIVDSDAE